MITMMGNVLQRDTKRQAKCKNMFLLYVFLRNCIISKLINALPIAYCRLHYCQVNKIKLLMLASSLFTILVIFLLLSVSHTHKKKFFQVFLDVPFIFTTRRRALFENRLQANV